MAESRFLAPGNGGEHLAEVMRPAFWRGGPGDEEPLVDEVSDAFDFFANEGDGFRSPGLYPGFDEIGVHTDGRGGITDFMSETGGNTAEGGKPFGLVAQFLFVEEGLMGFLQGAGQLAQFIAACGEGRGNGLGGFFVVFEVGKPARKNRQGTYDTVSKEKDEAAEGAGEKKGGGEDPPSQPGQAAFLPAYENEMVLRSGERGDGEIMVPDPGGGGFASCDLLENCSKIPGPSVLGRTDNGSVRPKEGDSDLENGG